MESNHWKGRYISSCNGNYILQPNGNVIICDDTYVYDEFKEPVNNIEND